jgi:hydrogenase nickel incorporation protein HypB
MFDFDMDAVCKRAKKLNPDIKIFPISARTGEGIESWTDWLKAQVLEVKTVSNPNRDCMGK